MQRVTPTPQETKRLDAVEADESTEYAAGTNITFREGTGADAGKTFIDADVGGGGGGNWTTELIGSYGQFQVAEAGTEITAYLHDATAQHNLKDYAALMLTFGSYRMSSTATPPYVHVFLRRVDVGNYPESWEHYATFDINHGDSDDMQQRVYVRFTAGSAWYGATIRAKSDKKMYGIYGKLYGLK